MIFEKNEEFFNYLFVEFDERTLYQGAKELIESLWILLSSTNHSERNLISWEVIEVVMIVEDLQNGLQGCLFEIQCFIEHFINSLATNDSEMSKVIVVSFK